MLVRQCDTKTVGFNRRQPDNEGAQKQPTNRSGKPKSPLRRKRRLPESNRCKRLCRPLRSHSAKAPRDRGSLALLRRIRAAGLGYCS
jgi:hypothetical protein